MRRSRFLRAWRSPLRRAAATAGPPRLPRARPCDTHVVLLDGTMSSLRRGFETNIGLTYRLLQEMPAGTPLRVYYEPGIQWRGWRRSPEVIAGVGLNRQIKRAYLFLARNYQPGDRIMLMGFSRGAYAARSLAGLIDAMGLLRAAQVTPETLDRIYDLYREDPHGRAAHALRSARCHVDVKIAFLGAYDTVRALGIRWPLIWRYMPEVHPYHNHALGPATLMARHALALDETRDAYRPMLWEATPEQAATGRVKQMWFRGTHGDVGGQIDGLTTSRPLSNIPLAWMLEEAEMAGLPLPQFWRQRFVTDASARSIGTHRGFGKIFVSRHRRKIGLDPSEHIHATAAIAARTRGVSVHPGSPNPA